MKNLFVIESLSKEILKSRITDFYEISHTNIKDEYWTSEHFLSDLEGKWQLSLYAHNMNNIAGFIIASDKAESIHIHKFIVDQKYQGLGLGKLLFNRFCNGTTKSISLKVDKTNVKAINFYKKMGFIIVSESGQLFLMKYGR